jgi:hypothetical protein
MRNRTGLGLAVVGMVLAMGCACGIPPRNVEPVASITFSPASVTIRNSAADGVTVHARSTGVVAVVITSVQIVEPNTKNLSNVVQIEDSPTSCLHPKTSIATPAFRKLSPGESCEIVLAGTGRHAGHFELHVVSDKGKVWTMPVHVLPQ